MRALGALVAVVVLSSTAVADTPTPSDPGKAADELFLAGRELVGKGDFAGACAKFFEAQKLQPTNVAITLNLGQCNEKQNKFGSALKWYRKTSSNAAEAVRNDPAAQEYVNTAAERAGTLANIASSIRFDLTKLQPGALATIGGETIQSTELTLYVDKGTHILEARLPGKKTTRIEFVVAEDGKQLDYAFAPLEHAPLVGTRRRRRLKGALIGGSVILVTSAITGLWANQIQNKFQDDAGEVANAKQTAKDKILLPSITFGAGVALGVGIAAYFFFTAPPGERQEEALPKTTFTPTISDDGLGFAMFRRF